MQRLLIRQAAQVNEEAMHLLLKLRLDAPYVEGASATGTASVSIPNASDGGGSNRSPVVDGRYTQLPLVPIQPTA